MDNAIIVALITLVGTVITVLVSNSSTRHSIMTQLDKHNAVQDERIRTLTDRVEKHNNVIERTYKLEQKVDDLERMVRK